MVDRAGAWWKFFTRKRLRRRRRLWRFVSPRRHRVALGLLVFLLAAVYVYWHFTNDQRVRQQAEKYLEEATGSATPISACLADWTCGTSVSSRPLTTFAYRLSGPTLP
jgi:type II secretory pathway component PulM